MAEASVAESDACVMLLALEGDDDLRYILEDTFCVEDASEAPENKGKEDGDSVDVNSLAPDDLVTFVVGELSDEMSPDIQRSVKRMTRENDRLSRNGWKVEKTQTKRLRYVHENGQETTSMRKALRLIRQSEVIHS